MNVESASLFAQAEQALHDGQTASAEQLYRRAHEVDPGHAEAWHMHGALVLQRGDAGASLALLARALELAPSAQIHYNVGLALNALGDLDQALAHMLRTTELAPNWSEALNNAGVALLECGRADEATHLFERAFAAKAQNREAASNYLMSLLYLPGLSAQEISAKHRSLGAALWPASSPDAALPAQQSSSPESLRLRLGFVSGDLCMHPVGLMMRGLLGELEAHPVDVFLYSNRDRDDMVARQIRAGAARWRSINELSDEEAALLIAQDKIDVLIDLSGHTAHNRLGVFTLRPSGTQVSWLGYGATTGLPCMDFILVDPHCANEDEQGLYSERLAFLPQSRLVCTPPENAPLVSDVPALGTGTVTLGCFNNFTKITEPVVRCWAAILAQLPNARLLLKGRQYQFRHCQQRLAALLSEEGVGLHRVLIEGYSSFEDYLGAFGRVDFALDPFPFPGGATTLDGLWMGVPTLTLRNDRLIGRQGVSILSNVGLHDWVARDEQHYVELALHFAGDFDLLQSQRRALRDRLRLSPLCDLSGFAQDFLNVVSALRGSSATSLFAGNGL